MSQTVQAAPEPVLEPDRRIVDPHHHLWNGPPAYLEADLRGDTGSGHRVEATVFIECLSCYRTEGPERLKVVGETEFVRQIADSTRRTPGARIAGIVGRADLTQGAAVEEVLAAHAEAGGGLFRGVRHSAAWDEDPTIQKSHHGNPAHLLLAPDFREGFARLAPLGLTFDAWLYHPQIPELTDLARAFPETPIVLDHFGGPLAVGLYAGRRAEVFADWRRATADLATCPNVFMKLGGMAMRINGYDWRNGVNAPSSEAFVAAQGDYYRAAIDLFGPSRCMFESNFPMDKMSLPYRTLWNAFKRIAAPYDEAEKDLMLRGAAAGFYRLDV